MLTRLDPIDAALLDDFLVLRGVERMQHVQTPEQAHDLLVEYVTKKHPGRLETLQKLFRPATAAKDHLEVSAVMLAFHAAFRNDSVLHEMFIYTCAMNRAPGAHRLVQKSYAMLANDLTYCIKTYGKHDFPDVVSKIKQVKARRDIARRIVAAIDKRDGMVIGIAGNQ